MAESLYNLALTKHTSDKPVETLVQEALELLDKTGDPYMEYKLSEALLFGQSGAILENLPLSDCERVQQKLLSIEIETLLQLATQGQSTAQTYTEPKPAAARPEEQTDAHAGEDKISSKNFIIKIKNHFNKQKSNKLSGAKTALADSLSRAINEDTDESYAEPEKELTGKSKRKRAIIPLSVAALLVSGGAVFFLMDTMNTPPAPETGVPIAASARADKPDTEKPLTPAATDSAQSKPQPATQQQASLASARTLPGAKGKTTQQSPGKAGEASAAIPQMSATELNKLKAILESAQQQSFGDTESGQYAAHIKQLKRLLELDKPDLALVFAETVPDPYAAALLILNIAQSEQQNKRTDFHDDILLTMKHVTARNNTENQQALLTAALSQTYTLTGDSRSAAELLSQALREMSTETSSAAQQIACLSKMVINHQSFAHAAGKEQLTAKLEEIAARVADDEKINLPAIGGIYTRLAATSLQNNDLAAAANWIKRIPAPNAREHLLTYLNGIKSTQR